MRTIRWLTNIIRLSLWFGLMMIFVPQIQAQWKLLFDPNDSAMGITGTPYFLNLPGPPRIGLIAGYDTMDNFRRYGYRGLVFKTIDGGEAWKPIPITNPDGTVFRNGNVFAAQFVFKDSETGWVIMQKGSIFKTTNQGESWSVLSAPILGSAIYYDSASDGLFASAWGAATPQNLWVSWDEGTTWEPVLNSDFGYNGFAFGNDTSGVVAGTIAYPTAWMRTTDAGRTWQQLAMDSECYQPVAIKGTQTQFAITDYWGNILRTDNLWNSWRVVYSFPFYSKPFTPYSKGFTNGTIAGDSSHLFVQLNTGVYMSTDQGRSWKYLCGEPYDTADYPIYDHRFWVRYPYVCILTHPPANGNASEVWMLNVDSMQYFPTGIAFVDGTKRTSVQAGTPVTINYSPETSDPIGIDTAFMVFQYDSDAFSLASLTLPPKWSILDSSSHKGILKLTLLADSTAAIPSPMVQLTFNTFLTSPPSQGGGRRVLYLDSAYLSGHRLNCDCQALSILGPDSVEVDFTGCEDSLIEAAMQHAPPFTIESIVPNPAQTEVTVTVSGMPEPAPGVTYQLFDALGRSRLSGTVWGASASLDVTSLASGCYYLRLSSNGYAQSRSIAIER